MKQLLNHEQGHFIIAILSAKNLKKSVGNVDFTKPNVEVPRLQQTKMKIDLEAKEMNSKYESETRNGRNKTEQARWDKYVQAQLTKLEGENIGIYFK